MWNVCASEPFHHRQSVRLADGMLSDVLTLQSSGSANSKACEIARLLIQRTRQATNSPRTVFPGKVAQPCDRALHLIIEREPLLPSGLQAKPFAVATRLGSQGAVRVIGGLPLADH
eukprot:6833402-Pyramimonas_sp.AAC.2